MSSKVCKKCGSIDFGKWTSSSTGMINYYCRNCRRGRAEKYSQNKAKNGGSHTRSQWLKKLKCFERCPRCNRIWSEIPPRPDKRYKYVWTKDHILPLTKGGSDDISNIQPLCYQCNSGKCNRE